MTKNLKNIGLTKNDLLILAALACSDPSVGLYGIEIIDTIKRDYGTGFSLGSLYGSLTRLENAKMIKSHMVEPDEGERNSHRRRYFIPTGIGVNALNDNLDTFNMIRQKLSRQKGLGTVGSQITPINRHNIL